MLDDLKFVSNKDPHDELGVIERKWRDKSDDLAQAAVSWRADSPTPKNLAKQIAEYLAGKAVVVYSTDTEEAHIWYKNIAHRAQARCFPVVVEEEVATEIAAWKSQPIDKLFGILLLVREEEDNTEIENMKRQLSGIWPHPMTVQTPGPPKLQTDWSLFLAEMSAAYVAILHGVSPKIAK